MARCSDLHELKIREVIDHFNKLSAVKEFGVKKYTNAYCVAATAHRFFIRPKTVENYIYR